MSVSTSISYERANEIKDAFAREYILSGVVDTVGISLTKDGFVLLVTGGRKDEAPTSYRGLPVRRRQRRVTGGSCPENE